MTSNTEDWVSKMDKQMRRKKIGEIVEYFWNYVPFVVRNGVRFTNWKHHREILSDPEMYLKEGFTPETMVFDIGSQYGDWAILWAKKFNAEVWAFEPLISNITEMRKDLWLNRVAEKVHAVKTLVGDGTPADYKINGDMASFVWSNHPNHPTMRIDDFVSTWNKIPDLMKIDVEGFEYQVLKGAEMTIDRYHPKIIIETHSVELREKCDEFLTHLGYDLIYKGREVRGSGWMDEVTNLFYAWVRIPEKMEGEIIE